MNITYLTLAKIVFLKIIAPYLPYGILPPEGAGITCTEHYKLAPIGGKSAFRPKRGLKKHPLLLILYHSPR